MSYQWYPAWFNKKLVKFYAAGLTNHLALNDPLKRAKIEGQAFGKQNWAWYAGASMGTVKKMFDWAIDVNFQWVQAQAVPSFDMNGIGRGNVADAGLITVKNDGSGGPTTKATATGNGNFYGFMVDGTYAFTNNLVANPQLQMSWTLDKNLGPKLIYKQFEMEFIYAF